MKISYNWLKDYVDIKLSPEKLADLLTMSGLSVDSVVKSGGDSILEVEITSNRPDWLSYIGVAREVAALTGAKLKTPKGLSTSSLRGVPPKAGRRSNLTIKNTKTAFSVKILDKKLCPRYTARVIRNVKVGESPEWLKNRIESAGLRPVNNIVDITNFCLLETGEPMHAFDLDKLGSQSIIVRTASKGEKIKTIDGVERSLESGTLVIADDVYPVAIAGIMGGCVTEVGSSTKNILLEAAYFDPIAVRRASRALALSTESSYRFERKVDIENIARASDRAAELITKLARGEACEFIDIGKLKPVRNILSLRPGRLNKVLGVKIPVSRIKSILASLGLKVKASSGAVLKLEAPQFRYDLKDEIDLIEEVARIYGYDNIGETLPSVVEARRLPEEAVIEDSIEKVLRAEGMSEIITYSLMARKLVSLVNMPDDNVIGVKNPLSAEQEIMRPTLMIGLLNSIRWNLNRKSKDLRFFESGKVYFKGTANDFKEVKHLSLGMTGRVRDGWLGRPRAATFFDLKGIVETLLSELGVKDFSVRAVPHYSFSPAASASIELNGESIGIIGQVEPGVLVNFDIKDAVYACELDCEKLSKHASLKKRFEEPQKYPSVVRDISLMVDKNIFNARILSTIRKAAGNLLKDAMMVDRYTGGQIPDGKVGLTYRLEYRDPGRTLEEKDIQEAHSRMLGALESELGAKLR